MSANPTIKISIKGQPEQVFELSNQVHVLGRSEQCDICVPNSAVSSKHCRLERQENEDYLLTDQDSTNGTIINGTKLEQKELQHGDVIRIGDVEIHYQSPLSWEDLDLPPQSENQAEKKLNLQETAGTANISEAENFSPFAFGNSSVDQGMGKLSRTIGIMVIGVLAVAVLIILGYVVVSLYF